MNTVGLMWPPIEPRSDLPFSSSEPGGTVTGAPLLVMTEAVPRVASDSTAAAITAGLPVVSTATLTPAPVAETISPATSASSRPVVSIARLDPGDGAADALDDPAALV